MLILCATSLIVGGAGLQDTCLLKSRMRIERIITAKLRRAQVFHKKTTDICTHIPLDVFKINSPIDSFKKYLQVHFVLRV